MNLMRLKLKLVKLGYIEIQPNLFMLLKNKIQLYHDFRKRARISYAFKNDRKINVKNLDDYKLIRVLEEKPDPNTLEGFQND